MKIWPFLYSLQFETGVIRAGVNGAGVKKGPALKGPIRYMDWTLYLTSWQMGPGYELSEDILFDVKSCETPSLFI